ncbi:hypothetical protein D3C85_1703970 [compost metagenome]
MNRYNRRAEQLHSEHIKRLPASIFSSHIDDAFHIKHGAGRCRSNTVLSGTGLGDNSLGTHPLSQQNLANSVVDLMRPSMIQILAL